MLASAPPSQPVVVIIEDDAAVLNSLEFALGVQGYAVLAFAHPAQALKSRRVVGADCLVIDYALPDSDGVEVLAALRARGVDCPAIIIASNPTARARQRAAGAGAPLIEKPLMGDLLASRIGEAIAARG